MFLRIAVLFIGCAGAISGWQPTLFAGTIVPDIDDNDSSLVFSDTTVASTSDGSFAPTLANGLTLAAQITPTQADIDSPADKAVAVIETGGTTSGTGLWIVDGDYWFLTSSGNPSALPTDSDGANQAIGVNLGAAVADQQNEVWASFDGANALLKGSVNGVVTDYLLANVNDGWNWAGNKSVSLGEASLTATGANLGWRGGLVDNLVAPATFDTNAAVDLDGAVSLGQVFNTISNAPATIPEPSSIALVGLLAAGLLRRRSRS